MPFEGQKTIIILNFFSIPSPTLEPIFIGVNNDLEVALCSTDENRCDQKKI